MLSLGSFIVSFCSLAVAIGALYFANDALSAKRPWVSVVDDDAGGIPESPMVRGECVLDLNTQQEPIDLSSKEPKTGYSATN
jgi:hypothetical protein